MIKKLTLCALVALSTLTTLRAAPIFPTNSTWKYMKGTAEASSPDTTAWRALGFDDSTWASGAGAFYYDTDTSTATGYTGQTQLPDMQGNYTCIFLRKTFTVSNPSAMAALRLTGICDDGFIAWVNGREIGRFNMPAGVVAFNGLSSAALGEPIAGYVITTNNPADFLVAGNNVICIQAFNSSLAGSSDFTIDAGLTSIEPDAIPPVLYSVTPAGGSIVSNLTSVSVSFSEPVSGVNASDLLINGVAATNVTGSGTNFTFSFRQPAYGNVQFSWAVGHGITDFGFPTPNAFDATAVGATWQINFTDSTPPVVSIYRPLQFVTVIKLTNITVIFNEPVSGVDASDLLINGAPANSVTSLSSTQYVFQFPQPPNGTVNVQWAGGHGIQDQAGVPNNFAGGSWTYNLDPNAVIGGVRINEFMAANANGIVDEDNSHQDWVELLNFSSNVVSLAGWSLTDDASVPDRWVFPEVSLQPGKFMLIWCSGKDRKPLSGTNMHTNFKISNGGGHLALLNSEDPRQVLSAYDYPIQRADISYGLEPAAVGYGTNTNFRYFQPSTPRAANLASAITAIVGDIHFDVKRGFYNAPIAVTITCDSTNATIRYTTNGSAPTVTATATNGSVFTTALVITNTSTIRAAAFIPGALASDSETHTYLFTADIIREPDETAPTPQWPAERKATAQIYDYGMDPNIVNLPAVAATIQDDLKFIPSYCISMDLNDLFSPSTGIYANPGGDTFAWERPGSIELIYPEGDGGFQINGGVRIRGGFSRDGNNPKHAFRFFFRQEYGKGKLDYPAFSNPSFGPKPPTSFNKYDLRTMQNYSWAYQNDTRMMCLRDVFSRDAQLALGSASSHGDFYHLYINGVYWGLYNTDERPEANFGADYYGGNADDYDTIKVAPDDGYIIYATDGDLGAWTRLWNQASAPGGLNSDAAYEKVQGNNADGTPNPAFENLLDVDNMIDYMLVIYYGGNLDAPISNFLSNTSPNNFFGFRDRTGTHGGFRFVAHDSEHTLLDINADRTGPFTAGDTLLKSNPQYFYQQMWGNAELRMRSADHIQKACFNGGPLSPEGAAALLVARSNVLWHAISAESARWGDAKREPPFRREDWLNAFNTVMTTFVPGRTTILLNQLRGKGLYPTNFAPVFSKFGGLVPAGYNLSITNPNPSGIIYYTLDGTDPRARGGAVSASGLSYSGPITLNAKTTVRARIKDGGTWSAIVEATFFVDQDFSKFIVSELMYNPPKFGTNDGDNYEFLELKNTGTNTLDLGGLTFTSGINFTFTNGTRLAPNSFFVLAHTTNGLTGSGLIYAKYPGLVVNGFYTGRFDNNGEKITISHPLGTTVLSFTYSDTSPWPVAPDGNGFSLVPRDPNSNANPDSSTSWRASANIGGSPGADDPASNIPAIVVNEVLTHSLVSALDRVELFNPTPNVVDVGGWFLTDDNGSPYKFRIPNNTFIQPNGYLAFNEDDFNPCANRGIPASCTNGFQFDSSGEQVYLFSGDANTNLTGYSHGFSFAAADPDVSFGRYINTAGEEQFPAQSASTFGAANAGPRVGPVVINEINYHPGLGFDEFVELKNITGSDVQLYDPLHATNRWKISGLNFTFPAASVLPANGFALVVNIQPAVFRTKYSIPAEVQIFGPFSGTLQDSGELLEVTKPETPPATNSVHYIIVDAVRYNDKAPWPSAADGDGPSLQRVTSAAYANDPVNWFASGITPGSQNILNTPPTVTLVSPADGSVFTVPFTTTLQANATDPDGTIGTVEFYQDGVKIGEATTPPYTLAVSNISVGSYSFYARAIDNGFSVSKSGTNTITVQFPPGGNGIGLLAEYWTQNGTLNANFGLPPTVVTTNATVNFDWGSGTVPGVNSPDSRISVDNFSGRWTGVVQPRFTDTYNFYTTSDDGVRLYINNNLVINNWSDHGPTEDTSTPIRMVAGQNYAIRMEWEENGGGAVAQLRWGSIFLAKEVVPASQMYPYGLPVIASQASGQVSVPTGSNYVLNATLLGQAPFTAQWFFNDSPIGTFDNINNGQTSITIPNAQAASQGAYYFTLSNVFGVITSLVANVSVGSPVSIAIPPSNVTALEGDTVNFGVTVSGTPPFTYIWTRGTFPAGNFATNVSSFTSDAITLPNVAFTNANTYRVTVQNSFGPAATATATLAISYAPKITTQPTNQLAAIGGAVTFSVAATSVPAPSYFWYFNQTNLVLTGTNRLTLSNIQPNQAGPYNVVVSNSIGSVTSSVANLVLGFGPTITAQPQSISAAIGGTAVFSMSVTGTFPMGATLRKSGIGFLNQAINDSNIVFTIANVKASDASVAYSIKVTNDFNKTPGVTSASFALTILTPPAITTNPTNFATSFGSTGYFAVVATGVPTPTYQWYFNVTNLLVGATNASLTVTNAQAANSGLYHAVAINSQGTATSTVATLNLPLPPNIIIQPVSAVTALGTSVTFRVTATGLAPLKYFWQFNGSNITAAVSTAYTLSNPQLSNEGPYRVVITNTLGAVTSSIVTLVIDSDLDGMPDAFELAYGLNPRLAGDASGDLDGDGVSNYQEYLAGTNPTNAASFLKLTSDGLAPDGSIILRFTAVSNRSYSILSKPTIDAGSWLSISNILGVPADRIVIITNTVPGGGQRYYRLVTPQTP